MPEWIKEIQKRREDTRRNDTTPHGRPFLFEKFNKKKGGKESGKKTDGGQRICKKDTNGNTGENKTQHKTPLYGTDGDSSRPYARLSVILDVQKRCVGMNRHGTGYRRKEKKEVGMRACLNGVSRGAQRRDSNSTGNRVPHGARLKAYRWNIICKNNRNRENKIYVCYGRKYRKKKEERGERHERNE